MDVERVRQVEVNAVRRTFVRLTQKWYHVPASIACDRVGFTEAYNDLFIHHFSPLLADQRSLGPCPFVGHSEVWFPRIPEDRNLLGLDVLWRAHRYEVIMASRLGRATTSDGSRMLMVECTDAAAEHLHLQSIRRAQPHRGLLSDFAAVPPSVRSYLPAGLAIPQILTFRYLAGVTRNRDGTSECQQLRDRFGSLARAEFLLRAIEGLEA